MFECGNLSRAVQAANGGNCWLPKAFLLTEVVDSGFRMFRRGSVLFRWFVFVFRSSFVFFASGCRDASPMFYVVGVRFLVVYPCLAVVFSGCFSVFLCFAGVLDCFAMDFRSVPCVVVSRKARVPHRSRPSQT